VIHALATLHGDVHRFGIADVALRAFDVEASDGTVVGTGPD
jgi:hypothetical protein